MGTDHGKPPQTPTLIDTLRSRGDGQKAHSCSGVACTFRSVPKLPPTKNSRPRRQVRRANELAATFERRCEKPVGWMDQEYEPLGAASPAHKAERSLELDVLRALRALLALPPEQRLRIAAVVVAQAERHRLRG